MTLPALLGSLKPVFDDTSPTADNDAFFAVLPIARCFVEAQIRNLAAKARSKGIVLEAIAKAGTSAILEQTFIASVERVTRNGTNRHW